MKFKTADNMLVFDGGNMTVKTEILGYGEPGSRPADPHNEAFARFFTEHYAEIAQKYPIYKELDDYGKLVALAKYLKDSGIPLYWFLMANKDLILTEDSPGTVDNLAKKSDYWAGVTIQGGVDMTRKGQFVFDTTAVKALEEARRKSESHTGQTTPLSSTKPLVTSQPFSFGLGTNRYTVTPQHSLSCGKDRRGIRYQTDLCLRAEGFKVTDEVVEAMQVELLRSEMRRLLQPEIEKLTGEQQREKNEELVINCYRRAAKTVKPMQDKIAALKGQKYSTDKDCAAAWDQAIEGSEFAGLRIMFVRRCHYVSNLEIVRYFNPTRQDESEFGKGWRLLIPYGIRPAGKGTTIFLNARIPERMEVVDHLTGETEALVFSNSQYSIAGYVPVGSNQTQWVGLFLMNDASFRLVDKVGSEFWFDGTGKLTDMVLSEDHHMHVEYLDNEPIPFKKMPYLLEEAGAEKVMFRSQEISKQMSVINLSTKETETFDYDPSGQVVGYVPEKGRQSSYKFLGVMTDGSYRLLDKRGNEIDFTAGGVFERMIPGGEQNVVRSMSSVGFKVQFDFTLTSGGKFLVASARLVQDDKTGESEHVIQYAYDNENRLCAIERNGISKGLFNQRAMLQQEDPRQFENSRLSSFDWSQRTHANVR
ncbi:MAG: hypothetical protein FJ217_14965 [Ignavibacteria bacterium]|nr:hypothetical protein [Ignavibacteria bacterium]